MRFNDAFRDREPEACRPATASSPLPEAFEDSRHITQLCQTRVNASVGGGDSGSPVFRITSGDNVQLVGILWGGSSNGASFIFSPLKNMRDELGSMTTTN